MGRPIAYKGDPDSILLTEGERRKVKRRIANRDSARRVRARRAETLEELQIKAGQMTDGNASLQGRVAEAENIRVAVQEQVQDFQQKLQLTISDNVVLRRQLDFLQKQVGGKFSMELGSPGTEHDMSGSSMQLTMLDLPGASSLFTASSWCDSLAGMPLLTLGRVD